MPGEHSTEAWIDSISSWAAARQRSSDGVSEPSFEVREADRAARGLDLLGVVLGERGAVLVAESVHRGEEDLGVVAVATIGGDHR